MAMLLTAADADTVEEKLARGELFWLDLHRPTEREYALLRDVFGFHPLAIEDSEHFGQRAKLEDYDDFVFLVLYGASPDEDRLVEIHCFYSERYLVTVHRDDAPALTEQRSRLVAHKPIELLYRVLDALVDGFFPVLAEVDDRLDAIQEDMLRRFEQEQLQELFDLRRRLAVIRKAVVPERDLVGRLVAGTIALPGMTEEAERYFRDVYDHLVRLADAVDVHRDLIAGSTDLYMSTASNRLNAVMKQLAVIATVFLPLTFIVGFFGQNFPWMVDHIGGWPAFVGLGIGLEAAAVAAMLVYFKRRGWF
jgi:magnesium transporter